MPVPNEITFTDMSQLFASGGCNGNGSKVVTRGAITSVSPCHCEVCESGKAERKQAYIAFENKLAAVGRGIDGSKSNQSHRIQVPNEI